MGLMLKFIYMNTFFIHKHTHMNINITKMVDESLNYNIYKYAFKLFEEVQAVGGE